jgi:shikimate kinase / 3-dehydroquinate synthase
MTLPLRRNIYFTGFMATGKSRIGQLTAASLGRPYFDTDKMVEEKAGKNIPQIFAEDGEPAFRRMEVEVLRDLADKGPYVCSLGGGTLLSPEALQWVRENGALINLYAEPEILLQRVNRKKDSRPLLAGLDDDAKLVRIREMLAQRQPLYDLADFKFESAEDVPHHILTRRIIHRLQIEECEPLWVELGDRRYPIYIEEDLSQHMDSLLEKVGCHGRYLVVSDTQIKQSQDEFLHRTRDSLGGSPIFWFKPGEGEKHLKSVNKLLTFMLRHGYSRKTALIAFSGGVVGDMTGFAASIYMRGIDFVQMPTTLLAMVDSSVGGKTGINHPLGKNLIGSFWQPRAVAISLSTLSTLPRAEYLAGLAEVVKYGVIRDPAFFAYLESHAAPLLQRDPVTLKHVVRTSCAVKAEVVGDDERELRDSGRAILNYGHTFGHAFEVLAGYGSLAHGLAVALGMRCAARLGVLLGMMPEADEARQNALLDALDMPKRFPRKLDAVKAYEAMALDKKAKDGKLVFILPTRIGEVVAVKGPDRDLVLRALEAVTA